MSLTCISLKDGREIPIPRQTVLCLGSFDGVHLAHQALLRRACAMRDSRFHEAAVGVFCFREPPARLLRGEAVKMLCEPEERLQRFASCGMEFAVLADFSELRELTAEDYVEQILLKRCGAEGIVCGFNHRFGRGGLGDPALLRRVFGNRLLVVEEVAVNGKTVSSSEIRRLISEKRMQDAAALLGRPYSLTARVMHGKALGRTLGIPTVNQNFPSDLLAPPNGVYRSEVTVEGKTHAALSNVGVRPTVEGDGRINCETHLLDYSGDLYGKILTVSFLSYLREEKKFETVEALQAQLMLDLQAIRSN